MTVFPSILPNEQRELLRRLGPLANHLGCYLAGGTAVALHLGHRRSIDFDWFTPVDLGDPLELANRVRDAGLVVEVGETAPGTLHCQIEGVRVSFLRYRYPLLLSLVPWAEYGFSLADLSDLACMKLAAAAQRGAKKDFIDIAAILRNGFTLTDLFDLFRRKYAVDDIGHLMMALCYFDDAEADPSPIMLQPVNWEDTKSLLTQSVREYAQK